MILIHPDQNGPPGRGHGGVTAGRLATLVDARRAVVRLHAPVPLGRELHPTLRDDGGWDVTVADALVATVGPLDDHLEPGLEPIAADLVERAEARFFAERDHPFPTCFACGDRRPPGTGGLGLRPGPVGDGTHATWWAPAGRSRGGEGDPVEHWRVWAALDCPTGVAAMDLVEDHEAALTGELAVDITAPVRSGVRHQVLARALDRSGRKIRSVATIVDVAGRRLASARATWIVVPAPGDGGGRGGGGGR